MLWDPKFFGVKPELVIKGGMINYAAMGDPGASIPTPQPVRYRPMFGAEVASTRRIFTSKAAILAGVFEQLGIRTPAVAVSNTRELTKASMIHNDATPDIQVDPETFEVRVDGEIATCEPAEVLPMAQRYFLF